MENFVLPLSHDEVVHGKGSLLRRMPGDDWQKYANLRLLYAYMFGLPGKKLLFMGAEIAQWDEWQHDRSLDWDLLQWEPHRGVQRWVQDLNRLYRSEPALHVLDFDPAGFDWIDCSDTEQSIITLLRRDPKRTRHVVGLFNFTPVPRWDYRVGVPRRGHWAEVLNSDAADYGGSGQGNLGGRHSDDIPWHGQP